MTECQNQYTVNIVDTGIFRAIGKPPNEQFDALEKSVQRVDQTLLLTWDVYKEMSGDPTSNPPPSDSPWVAPGMESGWIILADELESMPDIDKALDAAEEAITDLSAHPKTACADEDASLIAMAVQLFEKNESLNVTIHTTDKAVAKVALALVPEFGYYDISAYFVPPKRVTDHIENDSKFTPSTVNPKTSD